MKSKAAMYVATCAFAAVTAVSLHLVTRVDPAPATEKAGEYIDDAVLTTKVNAAVMEKKNLKPLDISVESTDGVVTLSGKVKSSAQIKEAVAVAKHVKG